MLSADGVVGSWAGTIGGVVLGCAVSHTAAAKITQQRVLVWWVTVSVRPVETIDFDLKGHVDVVHIQEAAPGVGRHALATAHRQVIPAPFNVAKVNACKHSV
jgi:hypothetical protein